VLLGCSGGLLAAKFVKCPKSYYTEQFKKYGYIRDKYDTMYNTPTPYDPSLYVPFIYIYIYIYMFIIHLLSYIHHIYCHVQKGRNVPLVIKPVEDSIVALHRSARRPLARLALKNVGTPACGQTRLPPLLPVTHKETTPCSKELLDP